MRVLVIGSGGREHTLVWKLSQSPSVTKIYCVPGNPGIAKIAQCLNLSIDNYEQLAYFAKRQHIDLTVVGPEAPLVEGIVDVFEKEGLAIFGPCSSAALIEGSKSFSKEIMHKYGIPTADFVICHSVEEARECIKEHGAPIVVKADGLAAGKGVVVATTEEEALAAIDEMMSKHKYGLAGESIVLEEMMVGEEASVLAFTDGVTVVPMIAAQDHKRVFEKDAGPNTGGMGSYAPAPVITPELKQKCLDEILRPMVEAMKAEGHTYKGCLYAGLMVMGDKLKVVEFNARFGDPETQSLLPLLDGDLAQIMLACARGGLTPDMVKWQAKSAMCVVLTSKGYPRAYKTGYPITGIEDAEQLDGVTVFHAGTKLNEEGQLVTSGGRVLGVTAVAATLAAAQKQCYVAAEKISFEGKYLRQDIGWRALGK